MKKKAILLLWTALTLAAGLFIGCGSKEDPAIPAGNRTEEEAPPLEKEESRKDDSEKKKAAEAAQKGVKALKNEATAAPAEKTAAEPEKDAKTESAPAKAESDSPPEKPATNNNSGNAGNTKADPPVKEKEPGTPETPAHTHIWNEHTATKQEWVPNMVTVDDYETKTIVVGSVIHCNCGVEIPAEDREANENHSLNHILNGEDDGWWTIEKTEQQQVKVGSHEEDHGHYETLSYVDYYYCDCGATK